MQEIDIVDNITPEKFETQYFKPQKPLLILNGISEWHAVQHWSPEYFYNKLGDKKVKIGISQNEVFSYSKVHKKSLMKLTDIKMKDLISNITDENIKKKYYLVHEPITENFQELLGDFTDPPWIKDLRLSSGYSQNLWVGAKGNITPAHWDTSHNFLAQIYGVKSLWLFSPDQSPLLYPTYDMRPPNHSYISDIKNPDYIKFPKFRASKHAEIILNPGNVLFIPTEWWHQVQSLTSSISLNFWWNPKLDECDVSKVLRYRMCEAFKENEFKKVKSWIDIDKFDSYLDVAQYLVDIGYKWVPVVFCGAYAKETLGFFSKPIELQISTKVTDNKLLKSQDFESYLYELLNLAFYEDDNVLINFNLSDVIASLRRISCNNLSLHQNSCN